MVSETGTLQKPVKTAVSYILILYMSKIRTTYYNHNFINYNIIYNVILTFFVLKATVWTRGSTHPRYNNSKFIYYITN